MPSTTQVTRPPAGEKIAMGEDGRLQVPDRPVVPFIEGDGTGPELWDAAVRVFDAAVAKAYGGRRRIAWFEVYAGEKANRVYGPGAWLPEDTLAAFREYRVGIKGPLATPVGGGIRSINVALRQTLDLYACVRPVHYYPGVPSPVRRPELVDMYEVAQAEFGDRVVTWAECGGAAPPGKLLVKDCIADNFLQEILLMPGDHDVIASCNLNRDYISDALAAQVGGLGIAPGANINYATGHACFEATHGTAPRFAGQNKVNPSSVILSGVMMLQYFGWKEAAWLIGNALEEAIGAGAVTFDLARPMLQEGRAGVREVGTFEFAMEIIRRMS